MKEKTPSELLNDEIRLLEAKKAHEFQLMRQQYYITADQLKPSKIIASTLQDFITVPATGNRFIDNTIGMATGFLSRKFLFGASPNPAKKVIGTLLQFGISNVVYKNAFTIKAVGSKILQSIFSRKKKTDARIVDTAHTA